MLESKSSCKILPIFQPLLFFGHVMLTRNHWFALLEVVEEEKLEEWAVLGHTVIAFNVLNTLGTRSDH